MKCVPTSGPSPERGEIIGISPRSGLTDIVALSTQRALAGLLNVAPLRAEFQQPQNPLVSANLKFEIRSLVDSKEHDC